MDKIIKDAGKYYYELMNKVGICVALDEAYDIAQCLFDVIEKKEIAGKIEATEILDKYYEKWRCKAITWEEKIHEMSIESFLNGHLINFKVFDDMEEATRKNNQCIKWMNDKKI